MGYKVLNEHSAIVHSFLSMTSQVNTTMECTIVLLVDIMHMAEACITYER